MTGLNNWNSFIGDPILKLTKNGNTLTVKTGNIPTGYKLAIEYSTCRNYHRGRQLQRNRTYSKYRRYHNVYPYRAYRMRNGVTGASAKKTYNFQFNPHPDLLSSYFNPSGHYKVRATLRQGSGDSRTKYVSNIITI